MNPSNRVRILHVMTKMELNLKVAAKELEDGVDDTARALALEVIGLAERLGYAFMEDEQTSEVLG